MILYFLHSLAAVASLKWLPVAVHGRKGTTDANPRGGFRGLATLAASEVPSSPHVLFKNSELFMGK